MLYRLVYVSEVIKTRPVDMTKLVQEAVEFNLENNVTGALWFDGTYFVQLLEGEKDSVTLVFNTRIETSRSHHRICLSCFEPCKERLFSDWSMAYLSERSHSIEIAHRFIRDENFCLRKCSGDDLINLLCFLEDDRQHNLKRAIP